MPTIDLRGNTLQIDAVEVTAGTVTLSSNAGTITTRNAVITTESLTTAHTATQALTITLAGVTASDMAMAQLAGGTNTGGIPAIQSVVTGTNTITITLKNLATTTNAFNGTFKINLSVFKVV